MTWSHFFYVPSRETGEEGSLGGSWRLLSSSHPYASCLCHSWNMAHCISLRFVSFEQLCVRTAYGAWLLPEAWLVSGWRSLSWPPTSRRQRGLIQHSLATLPFTRYSSIHSLLFHSLVALPFTRCSSFHKLLFLDVEIHKANIHIVPVRHTNHLIQHYVVLRTQRSSIRLSLPAFHFTPEFKGRRLGSAVQYQDITRALKGITDFYPPESCLRELLQNADDAGATEIEYVLNTSTYDCDPEDLIDPELYKFRGPALVVRNDQIFTQDDIQSLCRLGDSSKQHDISVAGKFGRGFNSVYHWTDGPQIYSENRLLFQDPHHNWSDGGDVYETLEGLDDLNDRHCSKIKSQLKMFSVFPIDFDQHYEGTMIRIPLRSVEQASTSRIRKKETTTREIKDYLTSFAQEMGNGGLLFVKHITKVIIRVDKEVLSTTQVVNAIEVNSARSSVVRSLKKRRSLSKAFEMHISHSFEGNGQISRYAMQHVIQEGTGNEQRDKWASEEKLLPWVALAAQLEPLEPAPHQPKPLSSTLRLPLSINQPVFIHGLWAIAPDRQRLSTEAIGESWNSHMFSTLVGTAWTQLLLYRNCYSFSHEKFRFWPVPADSISGPWDSLFLTVVHTSINDNLVVWNTEFNCVGTQDAFFASESVANESYAPALAQIKIPVVYLPPVLIDKARSALANFQALQPTTVLAYLRENGDILTHCSPDTKVHLLEYLLKAGNLPLLAEMPLWPLLDGTFGDVKNSQVFLARDPEEQNIFRRSRAEATLDITKLSKKALSSLNIVLSSSPGNISLRYRTISDLDEDWPVLYPLEASSSTCIARPTSHDRVLADIWSWIQDRTGVCHNKAPDSVGKALMKLPQNLFLLPLNGHRIRRLSTQSSEPTLIIPPSTNCSSQLRIIAKYLGAASVFDEEVVRTGLKLALRLSTEFPDMQLKSAENLEEVVFWLHKNRKFIKNLTDSDRFALVRHLRTLSEWVSPFRPDKTLVSRLCKLPVFQGATNDSRDMGGILSLEWCTLTDEAEYVPIGDLPTVPNLPGVIFLSLENSDISYVCRTFKLVRILPAEQLVENYVIKGILSESSLTQRCRQLVSYTLKSSTAFSQTWKKKQGGTKFIPSRSALQLGRPGPLKAPTKLFDPTNPSFDGLFFADEHPFPDLQALGFIDEVLRDWGLQVHLTPSVAMSRVKFFASCGKNMEDLMKKVSKLLRTNLKERDLSDFIFIEELRSLKWLPAMFDGQTALCSPKQCRPKPDQTVVGHVFGVVDVNVDPIWSQALGWDRAIEAQVLIKQLEACVPEKDFDSIEDTLKYLERNYRPEDYVSSVQNIQCLRGATSDLFLPREIFLSQQKNLSRLAPYVDAIHPRLAQSAILTRLSVMPEPTLEGLLKIQHRLAERGPKLNSADLDVSIAIMDLASVYPRDKLTELKGPDENCYLVPISKLTVKDHSRAAALKNLDNLVFCHPKLQRHILSKLEIDTLRARLLKSEIELEDEDEDEFTPREDLLSSISDTLTRYAPDATFNEYLANAEDSGASKVEWLLDDCSHRQHPDTELLDANLSDFQGPALFVYNDGIFSDEDFKGLKRIGRGSKFDKELAIGMHGRGSLTMYHFTDVPMVLSASSLLVIDPHERNLPRNCYNKRKTGVKCEISTARKMFPHQLAPFEGLFGYSSDVEHFQGTIFRFPLRKKNARSSLVQKQSYIKVQDTKNLLTSYLEEARASMIFLRSVKEVSFKLRHAELHEWRVTSRICETESAHTCVVRVATSDPKNDRIDPISETTWWVGRYANTPRPQLKPPRKMLNKKFECGVAACVSTGQRVRNKVYCTLPTSILSSLPISYHGSFAITGDRQTIPVGNDEKDIMSRWNKWILEDCIADLYANFLAEICDETSLDVYYLWPNAVSSTDDTSRIVHNKFWKNLREHEYDDLALFPVIGQHGIDRQIVSLTEARFDFLPAENSRALQPLLSQICSNVVRPPYFLKHYFAPMLETRSICSLTPDYLQEQFRKDSSCSVLERFLKETPHKDRAHIWAHMAYSMIVPSAVKDASLVDTQRFDGCRILPLQSGKLETIVVKTDKLITPIYFVGTNQENALFYFAKDRFIDPDYVLQEDSKPHILWDIVRSKLFNVRSLELTDVGTLLLDSRSPLNGSQPALDKWLEDFWKYFNSHLKARLNKKSADKADKQLEETISSCGLVDLKICRSLHQNDPVFISIREFDSGPYLVAPSRQPEIELCEKLPGVILLHPDYIPASLRTRESSLSNPQAFDRFVKVLKRLTKQYNGGIGKFLRDNLQEIKLEALRYILSEYLESVDSVPEVAVLQSFPVWPPVRASTITTGCAFICLRDATVSVHKDLIHPWVHDLEKWVKTDFVSKHGQLLRKLGKIPRTAREIWVKVQGDIPQNASVETGQFPAYVRLIRALDTAGITAAVPIAVNGAGTVCSASSLYDDTDDIFAAAFRLEASQRFLHPNVRDVRGYFKRTGLRHREYRGSVSPDDYIQCIYALQQRVNPQLGSTDVSFERDAEKVLDYIFWTSPGYQSWPASLWAQISQAPIFKVRSPTMEPAYRRNHMQQLAGAAKFVAPNTTCLLSYRNVCWSQVTFLSQEPAEYVNLRLPNASEPLPNRVVAHLRFLIGIRHSVERNEMKEFLRDVKESYSFLQERRHQLNRQDPVATAKIWLNLEEAEPVAMTASVLDSSLTTPQAIAFDMPVDGTNLKYVRPFLQPFRLLLTTLGCPCVQNPSSVQPVRSQSTPSSPAEAVVAAIAPLRQARVLCDVTLKGNDDSRPIFAHRLLLAAFSGFFRAASHDFWRDGPITLELVNYDVLSALVDFCYNPRITLPTVSSSDDVGTIGEALDACLDFLMAADYLKMPMLLRIVEDHLLQNAWAFVRPDNVKSLLQSALDANASLLQLHCVNYIANNKSIVDNCT